MNPILAQIQRLVAEGLHPCDASIIRDAQGWRSEVNTDDWFDSDEVGDSLPQHTIKLDRANLPPGVSASDICRLPADVIELPSMSDEQAEAMIREVATVGYAPDWAAFAAPGERPNRWLCKPIIWLSEPLRSALMRKHGVTDSRR